MFLTRFQGSRYNPKRVIEQAVFRKTRKTRKQENVMRLYLGISSLVVGLYGLVSGDVLLGLLFSVAGITLATFFQQTRSDPR
jgi:hypothetical protein